MAGNFTFLEPFAVAGCPSGSIYIRFCGIVLQAVTHQNPFTSNPNPINTLCSSSPQRQLNQTGGHGLPRRCHHKSSALSRFKFTSFFTLTAFRIHLQGDSLPLLEIRVLSEFLPAAVNKILHSHKTSVIIRFPQETNFLMHNFASLFTYLIPPGPKSVLPFNNSVSQPQCTNSC
jgi:hypothetical protein